MWTGMVSVPAVGLNSRGRPYAARRSGAMWRHRSDRGDELRAARFWSVFLWDPSVRLSVQRGGRATGHHHIHPIFGLDMRGSSQPDHL